MVAAALALPWPAAAGPGATPTPFKGPLESGGNVKFGLQQATGGGYEVVDFEWNNLRIKCASGKHKHDGSFKTPIPVDENRYFEFEGLRSDGRGGAKGNGTFVDDTYGTANGQLKVWGRTGWGGHCRSGWVGWDAKLVTPRP